MNAKEAGVRMKRLSRCIKETRNRVGRELKHKIEESVSFIESCDDLHSTAEGKWLIIYAEQARQLISDPDVGLDKMNIALKQLEDHLLMCGSKLYPRDDSEPLRAKHFHEQLIEDANFKC